MPAEIFWSRGRKGRNKEVTVEAYDRLYTTFNPTRFDADAWVAAAKSAGMTYIVMTTKHHDGFCLWPSKFPDYSIATPPVQARCDGRTRRCLPSRRDQTQALLLAAGLASSPFPAHQPRCMTAEACRVMSERKRC